jgi:DNA-directed RNA polymerase II subunit RPB2
MSACVLTCPVDHVGGAQAEQLQTGGGVCGYRCSVPYAKDTIPLFIVFRAMGFVADKEILQHIVYDFGDVEMMDLLRPSIEEAVHVTSEDIALDWIGRRIAQPFMAKSKRIAYAKDVLQKELLPHIGIGEMTESKKAFFLGYMVHRMLLVALGRQPQTDRDNYAVKRLRMAGPLMADLFRCGRCALRCAIVCALVCVCVCVTLWTAQRWPPPGG